MVNATRVLILSGEGAHSDQWHALPVTSAALAEVLRRQITVAVVTSLDGLAARINDADVLLVNASADRTRRIPCCGPARSEGAA